MKVCQVFQRIHIFIICALIPNSNIEFAGAQTISVRNSEVTPLDSSIVYGRLPNGLQYFIKNIDEPDPKLHLRLYSKAGGNQEDKEQLNISHAVEHMAFKSSESFPEGIEKSPLLDQFNMSISDITAYNGSKLTQYYFTAPSRNEEAFKTGMIWFKDIANGLKLSEKDINQVRGELKQEFIFRTENYSHYFAKMEMYSKIFPCSNDYKNLDDFEKDMKSESLRNFYIDWYRPDLLAISIVGNTENTNQIEEIIKETFSDLSYPGDSRELIDCESNYFQSPRQFTVVERSLDSAFPNNDKKVDVHLFYRDIALQENMSNKNGLQKLIERQMLRSIINKRFRAISNYYNAPLLYVDDPFERSGFAPALEIMMHTNNFDEKKGLKNAMLVLKQLELYGVSESEWKHEKEKQLQNIHSSNPEDALYWINEIKRHYNTGEALPTNKKQFLLNWLENYSIKEFDKYVNKFLSVGPDDIGIIAPTGHKDLDYTEEEVRSWLILGQSEKVEPYELPDAPSSLMAPDQIEALKEVEVREVGTGDSGAREFILENGVKLVIQSSNQEPERNRVQIMIQGFSKKGAHCFPSEEFHSIINAPGIVRNSGVGNMDKFEINRYLTDKGIRSTNVSTYIDSHESGVQANATNENLEDVLQLISLYFTEPNRSQAAFQDWQSSKYESTPDLRDYFNFTVGELSGNHSVFTNMYGRMSLKRGMSNNSIEKTDLEVVYKRYKNLFGSAKDFTFIVSGDFETDTGIPLMKKYLGNLPNKSITCYSQEKNQTTIPQPYNVIEAPRQNNVDYTLYGLRFIKQAEKFDDWKEQLKIQALGEITGQMTWTLRFGKGYSLYSIWVGGKKDLDRNHYEIGATIECIPEEYPLIRKEFAKIVSQIKSGNIPDPMFRKGMNRLHSKYQNQFSDFRERHQKIYEHYRYNLPWIDQIEIENYIQTVTIEDIVETANKIYQEENLLEFEMDVN